MITIKPVGQDHGKLIIFYQGDNVRINESKKRFTLQSIKTFIKSKELNGGVTVQDCVEFELLNRKLLISFKNNQLYEIITDDKDKIYILLTSSTFVVTASFIEDNEYVSNISLYLFQEYNPIAIFIENFEMQLSMKLSTEVTHWYRNAMEENYNNF
ncbi:hypothetical protein [Flavobacterium sp.]|uniref:hypothetical protein n=1 Tax=Flavobacterium sp. TaxID=239 RepID=UPI0026076BAB|nr:hypothetical protein [Flavobacterium sp.]MDD3004557.1 hypothetical protein [Flavobacterium sp.]